MPGRAAARPGATKRASPRPHTRDAIRPITRDHAGLAAAPPHPRQLRPASSAGDSPDHFIDGVRPSSVGAVDTLVSCRSRQGPVLCREVRSRPRIRLLAVSAATIPSQSAKTIPSLSYNLPAREASKLPATGMKIVSPWTSRPTITATPAPMPLATLLTGSSVMLPTALVSAASSVLVSTFPALTISRSQVVSTSRRGSPDRRRAGGLAARSGRARGPGSIDVPPVPNLYINARAAASTSSTPQPNRPRNHRPFLPVPPHPPSSDPPGSSPVRGRLGPLGGAFIYSVPYPGRCDTGAPLGRCQIPPVAQNDPSHGQPGGVPVGCESAE